MALSHFVVLSVILAASAAKVTLFNTCRGVSSEHCSVTEVRIDPCKKSGQCALKLDSDASISFDFTPNFSSSNMKTSVDYLGAPFTGLGDDSACAYTSCPTAAGVSQTFNYNLHIGKKLPKGTYPITWKIVNQDNTEQVCCFTTTIVLKK